MYSVFILIFRKLRLSEPWNYKAPFLICVPYFFIYASRVSFPSALPAIIYSLSTGVGIAGLGYFINDLADRKADLKAGVANGTRHLKGLQIILVSGFFLFTALLPWLLYFPADGITVSLLINQFLLYILYAAPPFRLKERGLAGVVADALYAHANPALIGVYTFYLLTGEVYPHFVLLVATLVSWQFFFGLRSILQHQITDAANDKAAGSNTYAVQVGIKAVYRLIERFLVPLELFAFLMFTLVTSITIPAFFFNWPLYMFIIWLLIRYQEKGSSLMPLSDRLYLFFDYYYLRWMPLFFLAAISLQDPGMSLLFFIHLVLFNNGLTPFLKKIFYRFRAAQ